MTDMISKRDMTGQPSPKPKGGMICTECFQPSGEPMPTGSLLDLVKLTGEWWCNKCVKIAERGITL